MRTVVTRNFSSSTWFIILGYIDLSETSTVELFTYLFLNLDFCTHLLVFKFMLKCHIDVTCKCHFMSRATTHFRI